VLAVALVAALAAAEPGVRVVVLGVAQDGGLPHIGCRQEACERARRDASRRERVASLGLVDDVTGGRWLIDATPDIRSQLESLRRPDAPRQKPVDGILLTHAHAGHYAGLLELGREMLGADHVPVMGTPRMIAFLRSSSPWKELEAWGHVVYQPIEPGRELKLGSFRVTPLVVPHRDELSDTVGYRISGQAPSRSVLYVPDVDKWEKWDRRLDEEVRAVDLALLDATFAREDELGGRSMKLVPHPFVSETMALLGPELRRRVAFIHLNHTNRLLWDEGERTALEAQGARVALDGEAFPLR
jgi:pyrroloquinoline quinone biosynthesis protein B